MTEPEGATTETTLTAEVWSEEDILKLMNTKPASLMRLRVARGFPHVKTGLGRRVYLSSSVLRWLKDNEVRLKASELAM